VASTLCKRDPTRKFTVVSEPVNVGDSPTERVWEDGRTSEEMFGNLKAEIWWLARVAFQRTYQHMLFLEGKEGGKQQSSTEVISLPSGDPESDTLCAQLSLVRWFKNEKGKIVIEKKEQLQRRGIASPDYAEAFMLTFVDRPTKYSWDNF
jgi:phage terminase large subunit